MATDLTLKTPGMGEQSWAAQVEQELAIPQPEVTYSDEKGEKIKTVVSYRINEDGSKIKTTSRFKIVTKMVPKPIADRKKWKKFGCCKSDSPGVNPAYTSVDTKDEAKFWFTRRRNGELILGDTVKPQDEKMLGKVSMGMRCRHCEGTDHITVHCPYKDLYEELDSADKGNENLGQEQRDLEADRMRAEGKFVPVHMRGKGPPPTGVDNRNRDENTIRITNLPDEMTDADLRDLFSFMQNPGPNRPNYEKPRGISRIFLAKNKTTGKTKGFAFVTFERRADAEKAIEVLNGHKYDYLVLKVEWAQRSN